MGSARLHAKHIVTWAISSQLAEPDEGMIIPLSNGNDQTAESDERTSDLLAGDEWFSVSQRQATSKVSTGISPLSACFLGWEAWRECHFLLTSAAKKKPRRP